MDFAHMIFWYINIIYVQILIEPPEEKSTASTDEDSDDLDQPDANPKHLPRRLLRATGQVRKRTRTDSFSYSEPETHSNEDPENQLRSFYPG